MADFSDLRRLGIDYPKGILKVILEDPTMKKQDFHKEEWHDACESFDQLILELQKPQPDVTRINTLGEGLTKLSNIKNLELRRVVANAIANTSYPAKLKNILQVLKSCGLAKSENLKAWMLLLRTCCNFTHVSANFSLYLGHHGVLEYILQHMKEQLYGAVQSKGYSIGPEIVLIGNCALVSENRRLFPEDFCTFANQLANSLSSISEIISLKFTMSLVADPVKDTKYLELTKQEMRSVIGAFSEAYQSENHHGCISDTVVSLHELVINLGHLAIKNESNIRLAVDEDIMPLLLHMAQKGHTTEKECAFNLIWILMTPNTYVCIMKTQNMENVLSQGKLCDCEAVRNAAIRVSSKMESLRSGIEKGVPVKREHCQYATVCKKYKETLCIDENYLDIKHDMCYCIECHAARGDKPAYSRGNPPKDYGVPVGWFRFGLKVHDRARAADVAAFDKWHRAFHGTTEKVIPNILKIGDLLKPGEEGFDDISVEVRPGHFDETYGPEGFDYNQVFVSPSIRYVAHDVYASSGRYKDHTTGTMYKTKVAIQVLIEPNCYKVGAETVGAGETRIDPNFDNNQLEWSTKKRGCMFLSGILVKLEEM